jgi:hypothetical protein
MVRPSSPGKDSKGIVIGVPFFLSEAYSQAQLSTRSGTSSSGKPSAFEKEGLRSMFNHLFLRVRAFIED